MDTWRLVVSGPLDGVSNMAVDEALFSLVDPEDSRPVLRLYSWKPPAVSLGRFQYPAEVLNLEKCATEGIMVVKRITGGGMIYHADELTYSIVCTPEQIPAASSVKDSFRVLTGFLLCLYGKLGLEPRYAVDYFPPGMKLGVRTPFCFAGKESFDIMIGTKKIGGNAQRRRKNVIFQHGSIPLKNRAAAGAGFLRESPAGIDQSTCALADFNPDLSRDALFMLMRQAFAETFSVLLLGGSLTPEEEAAATS